MIARALATLLLLGGPAAADGFASPTGNILCYLEPSAAPATAPVSCLIFEATWPMPDADPTCDLDRTRMVTLPRRGPARAELACHGDVFWPLPLGTLGYGSEWSVQGIGCSMATDGVRCVNATGDGFHVRRAALTLR
ncbi:hypothetical protein [Jannaschia marina]|uniref:hypothetical protein n=1 Tax=Jannaschia marina TaxID=2741674 RepID=UPI0015CD1130|nr:hypothetical protein [Jannaschia marina]